MTRMRHGLHRGYTRDELNCLDAVQRGDMTTLEAAEVLGVSKSSIFVWMRRLGMHSGTERKRRREAQAVIDKVVQGQLTIEQAAEQLGVTTRRVRVILYERGYKELLSNSKPCCERCEILLSEAPKGNDKLCGWCVEEIAGGIPDPRYFDAMVVAEADTRDRCAGVSRELAISEKY